MPKGPRPRGVTPRPRSGAAAERSYLTSEVRGRGGECQAATAQEQPRGATPCLRPGAVAEGATPPLLQGAVAVPVQEGLEELFHVQSQKGRH